MRLRRSATGDVRAPMAIQFPNSSPAAAGGDATGTRTVLRIIAIVLAVAGSLILIRLLWQPLSWLVIATFLAIALSGPVNLLERRMRRSYAITIVYVALLLTPIALGALIVPPMIRQGVDLVNKLPDYSGDLQKYVERNKRLRKIDRDFSITKKLHKEANNAPKHIGEAAGTLSNVGAAIISSLFAGFSIIVLSLFMVSSGRRWIDAAIDLRAAHEHAALKRAFDRIGAAVGNYVGGAAVQATVAGVTAFIVMTILGVPFAAPLAILVGLFDLLPLVGALIAAMFVGVVTLFNDFPTATIVWVIFAIAYQQFENYVIQPQIQKRAVALQPFVTLVSVMFGATLFGVIGAILAVPTAATIQIAFQEWMTFRAERSSLLVTPAQAHSSGETAAD